MRDNTNEPTEQPQMMIVANRCGKRVHINSYNGYFQTIIKNETTTTKNNINNNLF